MEKFLMTVGAVILSLGAGFLIAYQLISGLHGAFVTGGYLWAAIGAVVILIAYKSKRSKDKLTQSLV